MKGVRVVTLNNRILLFGGEDKQDEQFYGQVYADILEYSEMEGRWSRVGEMSRARVYHGAAVVDFDQFKTHCQQ